MAKVLIEYEGNLGNLKAQLAEVEQANQSISDSAKQTAQQVGDEYRKVASTAAKAFAGQEVSKALQDQEKNVDALTQSLTDLYNEELRLLQGNKQLTDEFKKNRATFEQTRKEFDAIKGTAKALTQEVPKTAAEISKLEDRLRELALAGKQGTQEFDDIARAIGEYKAAITTADRAVDLYAKSTDAATGRLGELEDKLYDLALAGQTNTQEFKDTIAQVTNLKRAVFEVDQQVDSYVERSRGFATVVQNVELVGNAFQLVEGTAALFGEENEELQKTLVRLNAILAITQGLEQARTILLEQNAKKTGVAAIAQRGYALAVGTSTGALKAFRLALAATGVGLLVIGIASLIQNFDRLKASLFSVSPELEKFGNKVAEVFDKIKKALGFDDTADVTNARLDALVKAEERRTNLLTKELDRRIKLQEAYGKETKDLEIQRESVVIQSNNKILEFIRDNQSRLASTDTERNKKVRELYEKLTQEVLDAENRIAILQIKNLKKFETEFLKQIGLRELLTRQFEKEAAAFEEARQKELELLQPLIDNTAKANEALTAFYRTREQQIERQILLQENAGKKTLESELELIRIRGELRKQDARAAISNQEELKAAINLIDTQTVLEQEKLQKEFRQRQFEEITKLTFQYVNAIGAAFASIVDLQNELTERRIEQIETLRDKELEANAVLQQSYADRVRNDEAITLRASRKITEEKRKQARLDKALGIFNATIDTAQAVIGFLKDPGGVAGVILSVAAGITGATQIAKISSEPLPSFGKGGWIDGEPHTRGGVDINAEGGEFVTRKSQAGTFRRELEAMNTSRAAFLKVIEESYVRPRLAQLSNDRSVNVNVNARLNSSGMESRLDTLTKETRKTRRALTQAMAQSHSQRYSW